MSKSDISSNEYSFILNEMIKTAESNMYRDKNHVIYSDTIRYFSTYVFLLCGRSCYEMLRSNLPLPSVKTICKWIYNVFRSNSLTKTIVFNFIATVRCISDSKTPIVEGQIRAKELSEYLDRMKTTRHIWISEDATAIVPKATYDPVTNQLIGLVLSTEKSTGCPKAFTFMATDSETIKRHLEQTRSNVVHVVMAQPLDEETPPFVLQLFGSDNTFATKDVVNRWNITKEELKK